MRPDVKRALLPMEEAVRQGFPFEERLKVDPLVRAKQEPLCPPLTATREGAEIQEPRGSWRKPANWLQVAKAKEVLLAHHDGWRHVDVAVKAYYDERRGCWNYRGRGGRVCLDGTWLEYVKLPSLRIPDEGKKEARHG